MSKEVNTTQLTQGRIVRYVERMVGPARIVYPAMVVLTDGKSKCTLFVFDPFGYAVKTDVPRGDTGEVHTWHWPGALDRLEEPPK